MFENFTDEGAEKVQDRLGGFSPFKTDIYTGLIKMAYGLESSGGAKAVYLVVNLDGREHRETIYVSSGRDKGQKNTYIDKSGKVQLQPGYITVNGICLAATGKPLNQCPTEMKMVNVWDNDLKKEVPKSVPVLVDLIGAQISLGIREVLENKTTKTPNGYVPIADERTSNTIEKVFNTESKMTPSEMERGMEEGQFWDQWRERNLHKVSDKRKIKGNEGGNVGRPNAGPPVAGATTAQPAKSGLFTKKA